MIKSIFQQIEAIRTDGSLRLFGAFLSLTHIWTFFYWNQNNFFINSQSSSNTEPLCFPFFPSCDIFREQFSVLTWQWVLYAYLFLSILALLSFLSQKLTTWAYSLFLLITALKLFLHLSNYNFMDNYHYMVHIISLTYLFLPYKKLMAKYLLVSFYIAAGLLKINIDWLSGAAMIQSPYTTGNLLLASLYYVLFLELIFVFGLLHHNKWIRWGALTQFLAFHIFSWHTLGFFYPLTMLSLLSIFFIDEYSYYKRKISCRNHLLSLFNFKDSKIIYTVLVVFLLLQASPFLMTSAPSLSGAVRLSSLNMLNSRTECHSILVAKTEQGTIHLRKPSKNRGARLRCDPIVFLNQAHQLCRKNLKTNEIKQLSLSLFTKRVTQTEYKTILNIKDVCKLSYPLWAELGKQGGS